MSRLPQLEAQLVAAAGAPPRRSVVPRRALAGLAVAAAAAGLALAFAPRHEAPVVAPRPAATAAPTVPAATIERSHALTTETRAPDAALTPRQVPGVAAGFEASTPHPPGMSDRYDWAHPRAPIARAADIQSLVEYRSYCLWLRYWVDGTDRAGAAQVLADFPQWPTQRTTDPYESKLLQRKEAAIADGDVATIRHELNLNCRGV